MDAIVETTRLDEMVKKYIELRDKKAALEKAHKEKVAKIDLIMEQTERYFLAAMREQGLTALPTPEGVPYQSKKTSAKVDDPAAFRNWVIEQSAWPAMDVKANKTFVAQYKEDHADLPPGVSWYEEIVCNVRRS